MRHDLATHVLRIAAIGTALFGLALMLAPHTQIKPAALAFVDIAFLPFDGAQDVDHEVTQLMLAISGGVLIGLAVAVWQVTTLIYPQDPALARRILLPTLLAWYVPDSLGSVLSGAPFNVVMNTGFLALFLIPLLLARTAPSGDHQIRTE
ncbi:excinuclease ABC subunit A [Tritonibacter scottomollicae]|uniref:Excinuclease ABC subunit A n=1 Tax=Tritonibacter scottomollicae TaxID=483013 RepID=A0ABZ0HI34_TRISK|nr:excinuclease ABC subunit A [Tritonibacter scottomollicae]WOI34349.1 excinuclease ABC subunit A [Tritonibacter scottomollicae]